MIKLEAYVLNTQALTKSDVLITVLTKQGIFTIYGRGYLSLKHKFHVLTNRSLKVNLYGNIKGSKFIVNDYDLLSTKTIVTLDIELFEVYIKIVKLVMYIEKIIDETAFLLFDFTVSEIETYNPQVLIDLWKVYILKKENVILEFSKCIKCNREDNIVTISLNDGGLICNKCYNNEKIINEQDIKMLNGLYQGKLSYIKKGYNQQVSVFLTELAFQNLGLTIK